MAIDGESPMSRVAIVGAGASGLMAAQVLAEHGISVCIYEQMPTAGRKILMAGKTGLNISHAEELEQFISRYRPSEPIKPFVQAFHAKDIRCWLDGFGVESYVGSSGRIFPVQMKASGLLRAWLLYLQKLGVQIFYRHRCVGIKDGALRLEHGERQWTAEFDAVILACGGGSYARLGGDGSWQSWFGFDELEPLYASNVGVVITWSSYMHDVFGKPLKRVRAWVGAETTAVQGDIIITSYGLESGVIYRLNHELRQSQMTLCLDLLPDVSYQDVMMRLQNKKQSLSTSLKKLGLDAVKIAILRECTPKSDWSDAQKMTSHIKCLRVVCQDFRPMDEAISTGGGVRFDAMNDTLQLKSNPKVFCAGEMVAWDAPTGGYLLTACLAMGRGVADGVMAYLQKPSL